MSEENARWGFALSLIGGILILIFGIMTVIIIPFVAQTMPQLIEENLIEEGIAPGMAVMMGIWGIICGIIVMGGSFVMRRHKMTGGIVTLIFSILGVFGGGGFLLGSALGFIGGILGMAGR
jgi:hypothetical protein